MNMNVSLQISQKFFFFRGKGMVQQGLVLRAEDVAAARLPFKTQTRDVKEKVCPNLILGAGIDVVTGVCSMLNEEGKCVVLRISPSTTEMGGEVLGAVGIREGERFVHLCGR